jgi:hypothetical protein
MGAAPLANAAPSRNRRVPLWVKLAYTAFMCVLVPYYWWAYGPTNFLYFCDVALFMTLVAVWTESPLWASAPLVGIFMPQLLWQVDFLGGIFGFHVVGMTRYMFDETRPLFVRGLSFFHFWLPLFLLWLALRLGYDRRALAVWTVLAWVLILVCYFFMPPAMPADQRAFSGQPVNINYVYNPISDDAPQTFMPQLLYVAGMMILLPVCFYLPTHWLVGRISARMRVGREE